MNFESLYRGISTPTNELYNQLAQHGWEVTKLSWDKGQGAFVAEAKNQWGERVKKTGPDDKTALANLLIYATRHTHMRTAAQHKLGMWKTMFTDQLPQIAEAYARAPVYDPKVAAYFKELADDSMRRSQVLQQQLHIEVVDDPEPYANAQEMSQDIHKNRHFFVSRANSEHPIWSVEQNVAFRIVHDVLGHAVSGGDFGWQGENLACAAHFPLLTPTAQLALFTECIAQTAYAAYYRSFGPQKVAAFPEFVEGPQGTENAPGHTGIHPSQMAAPTTMPAVNPSKEPQAYGGLPEGNPAPHQPDWTGAPIFNFNALAHRYASIFADPNQGWESGFQPLQVNTHGVGNAYLDHGDPLESQAVMDNAALIDTGWSQFKTGDGQDDRARMKQAIVNAFRVVLLSPRKDLRWNAIHYQDIASVPADVDDPKVYWDTLEKHRMDWNADQVRQMYTGKVSPETLEQMTNEARTSHQAWRKMWPQFFSVIFQHVGEYNKARERAEEMLMDWQIEEHQRLAEADEKKPSDKQMSADQLERKAQAAMIKRMKQYIKDSQPKLDVLAATKGYKDELKARFDDVHEDFDSVLLREVAKQIEKRLSPTDLPATHRKELMELYAFLALSTGAGTKNEDIHDAWSYWTIFTCHDLDHESAVPYDQLSSKVKGYDTVYRDKVREAIEKVVDAVRGIKVAQEQGLFDLPEATEATKVDRYGAWMGSHLKAISKISQHVDEILDAALKDVRERDGAGHHFRSTVLSLNISGVGPKVCSFAWLLLQPMTSQLATIDTHMMDVLGHHYEKDMNNRDYFKYERELAAGRDAAGYSHIPLGTFQWGMWDFKRTGAGSHQDHSAMRVLDPLPHTQVDWQTKAQNLKGDSWLDQAPDWWRNTEGARNAVAHEWDTKVAPNFAQNQIPYQVQNDQLTAAKLAANGESPDEFHVGFQLPEWVVEKVAEVAAGFDIEQLEPDDLHMTALYADHGYGDYDLSQWVKANSVTGLRFTNARIDCFPGQGGKWAVVLRFDSPEARELVHKMLDEAEDRGIEPSRFDGGFKPHITLGYAKKRIEHHESINLEFRAGPLYISLPRPLRKLADLGDPSPSVQVDGEWDTGAPGESIMGYLTGQYGLSTPEVWAQFGRRLRGQAPAQTA
jgi:2'-5' RNA ligase